MPRLLLVRHGETDYNNDRRFLGYSDVDLSPLGERQVRCLRDNISNETFDAIYASDLKRTMKTAEIIKSPRAMKIQPCPELREMNYGTCEGLTIDEIDRDFPDVAANCRLFTPELIFPDGETFRDFAARTVGFLNRLKSHKPTDNILIVSHNGPLRLLILHFLGLDIEHWWQIRIDTASLSIVEIRPRGAIIVRLNDTSCLAKLTKE